MNKNTQAKKRWIRLDHADKETGVMVTAENEDRFALTMQHAIRGCKVIAQWDNINQQIVKLFYKLHEWLQAHSEDVDQAYVVERGPTGFLFLVVQKEKRFNPKIEDELTELDIEVAKDSDFELLTFSVLALPKSDEETVTSFLTRGSTHTYQNAERNDTPGNSES